jgi:hypothetical protein
MYGKYRQKLKYQLEEITASGLYKSERHITSAQQSRISVADRQVLNMCANNYLGLADNKQIIAAAKRGLDERGFGMASVRFICGTQDIHKQLEENISDFLDTDDTILYSSCFDANAGLFETLLTENDAVISDALIVLCGGYKNTFALLCGIAFFDLTFRAGSLFYSYLHVREDPALIIIPAIMVTIGYFGCILGLPGGFLLLKELRHAGIVRQ